MVISYSYLHEDIIRDILLRIPVKSLFRFEVVCKKWCSLITNSTFIDTHCRHPSRPKFAAMITRPDLASCGRTSFYRISMVGDGTNRVDDRIIPFETGQLKPGTNVSIVGCSNGLLCFFCFIGECEEYYILWNPATGQFRQLPNALWKNNGDFVHARGFGFHPRANNYKLLQITMKQKAEVFTLSTNSWKEVKDIPDFGYCHSAPVVIEGVWYAVMVNHRRPSILTFDMGDDTLSMMKAALPYDAVRDRGTELMVYKESLAMIWIDSLKRTIEFEIWAMKNESWTKLFKCWPQPLSITRRPLWPLGIWNDEEIIIQEEVGKSDMPMLTGLSLFNPSAKQSKILEVDNAGGFGKAHTYTESMVSVYLGKHRDGNNADN